MSIKRVACPGCKQTLNVPASMASTRCPSCGTVFSPQNPAPQNPAAGKQAAARQSEPLESAPRDSGRLMPYLIVGAVASLAIAGLLLLTFFRAAPDDAGDPEPPAVAPAPAAERTPPQTQAPQEFRVVDLPESTRKKIYNDYQRMIASSFGKSKRIPKSGAAGQALQGMLQGTVEREIERMALIHNVSEDDILQVIAEGDSKGW